MQGLEGILEEIDETIERYGKNPYIDGKVTDICYGLNIAKNIIRKHMNNGWISVEDRLPEDDVDVLVTYADIDDEEYADITTTTYGNAYLGGNKLDFKEWRSPFEYFKSNYKVTAWQYLPEPYRPERNSEE